MTMSRPRHPLAAGAGLAGAAALLLVAACEMPRPTEVSPAGEMPLASIRSGGAYTVTGQITPAVVREAVAATLTSEDVTAARGTPIMLYFVADASGRVVHAEYQRDRQVRMETSRTEAAEGERAQVRVRMLAETADSAAGRSGTRAGPRASSLPGAVASIDPQAIAGIEVLKAKAGEIVADSAGVIWVTLKPGATLESARLSEEAVTRRQLATTRERAPLRRQAAGRSAGGADAETMRAEGNVRITGTARLSDADGPLLVVEGRTIPRDRAEAFMRDLAPDRIASVEVLKGASATAKYGDAGANGVIQVVLKKP